MRAVFSVDRKSVSTDPKQAPAMKIIGCRGRIYLQIGPPNREYRVANGRNTDALIEANKVIKVKEPQHVMVWFKIIIYLLILF